MRNHNSDHDKSYEANLKPQTKSIYGGYHPDPAFRACTTPIYQATSFAFRDTHHASALFNLETPGHIYSRITNPTVHALQERMTTLEGATGVIAVANGGAALSAALINLLHYRDHCIAVLERESNLPTPLLPFFRDNLPRFGIGAVTYTYDYIVALESRITPKTKVLFLELSADDGELRRDLAPWKEFCVKHNLLLMAEVSAVAPHYATTRELGIDIGVITDSRFLADREENLAGFVIDPGLYDWSTGRFEELREPNPNAHGKVFTEAFGKHAYIMKVCNEMVRDFGFCLAPMEAFLIMQGIETLFLRAQQ